MRLLRIWLMMTIGFAAASAGTIKPGTRMTVRYDGFENLISLGDGNFRFLGDNFGKYFLILFPIGPDLTQVIEMNTSITRRVPLFQVEYNGVRQDPGRIDLTMRMDFRAGPRTFPISDDGLAKTLRASLPFVMTGWARFLLDADTAYTEVPIDGSGTLSIFSYSPYNIGLPTDLSTTANFESPEPLSIALTLAGLVTMTGFGGMRRPEVICVGVHCLRHFAYESS